MREKSLLKKLKIEECFKCLLIIKSVYYVYLYNKNRLCRQCALTFFLTGVPYMVTKEKNTKIYKFYEN